MRYDHYVLTLRVAKNLQLSELRYPAPIDYAVNQIEIYCKSTSLTTFKPF